MSAGEQVGGAVADRPTEPQTGTVAGCFGRAYAGDAHGKTWRLGSNSDPPTTVELSAHGVTSRFRLVRNPQSGRPARDQQGNYTYVPDTRRWRPMR